MQVKKFILYFQRTFIGILTPFKFKNALYNPFFWSVYDRVIEKVPTTTNHAEAWHRVMNRKNIIKSPNLANFVIVMQKEQKLAEIKYEKIKNGYIIKNRTRDFKELFHIVTNICSYSLIDYLDVISNKFKWKFE